MNANGQGLEDAEVTKDSSIAEPVQPEVVEASAEVEATPTEMEAAPASENTATVEETSPEGASEAPLPAEGDWLAQDTSDQKGP